MKERERSPSESVSSLRMFFISFGILSPFSIFHSPVAAWSLKRDQTNVLLLSVIAISSCIQQIDRNPFIHPFIDSFIYSSFPLFISIPLSFISFSRCMESLAPSSSHSHTTLFYFHFSSFFPYPWCHFHECSQANLGQDLSLSLFRWIGMSLDLWEGRPSSRAAFNISQTEL